VLLLEIDLKDRAEDAVEEVPPPPQPVQPLPQALPEPLASASPAAPARRFQALIVDDNEANCVIAQRMLARRGCDGDIVYSGMDAIARLQERSYDLILMDIQMPRMDGYETTRRIRAGAGNAPAIPIIAVTASATVDDVDRCMRAGMNAHIAKPVQLRRLSELLQQFLGTHETEHTEIGPLEMEKQNDTAPELPVFDPARLQQIAIGDSLLLARLTGGFVADVPAKVNSLAAMIERGDLSGAERAAHYVKGAARNIGASRLGQAAADAESAAKSCSIIELQQAAQQTRLELTRLIEEWQDIDWSKLA
jgi:CheY-like chemotaxis protein/HPt (histidine-containing phosphotransfer) domain-containing protein